MSKLVVFHHDDFDGCARAAILAGYFQQNGLRSFRFVPVNYDVKQAWARPFPLPVTKRERIAVVDFLFHPEAEIWFDHHPTTFVSTEYATRYHTAPRLLWEHNSREPSCAQQIYRYLWALQPSLDRFEELIDAANMIDQAAYPSAEAALSYADPAIAINNVYRRLSIGERSELVLCLKHPGGLALARTLVERHIAEAEQTTRSVLGQYPDMLELCGPVARLNLLNTGVPFLRYAHFLYYPQAQYGLTLYEVDGTPVISVGRNPWNPGSADLGELALALGGGGHFYAAGVSFPNATGITPLQAFRSLTDSLQ